MRNLHVIVDHRGLQLLFFFLSFWLSFFSFFSFIFFLIIIIIIILNREIRQMGNARIFFLASGAVCCSLGPFFHTVGDFINAFLL
jgi:polyferredoxin